MNFRCFLHTVHQLHFHLLSTCELLYVWVVTQIYLEWKSRTFSGRGFKGVGPQCVNLTSTLSSCGLLHLWVHRSMASSMVATSSAMNIHMYGGLVLKVLKATTRVNATDPCTHTPIQNESRTSHTHVVGAEVYVCL